MDNRYYLSQFNKAIALIDKGLFQPEEVKADEWLNCIVMKIQRTQWLGNPPVQAFEQSVFFSVWVSDESLKQDKLEYNIHALSMREIKGYRIKSRDFAEAFRKAFKPYEKAWPNVSTDFGPQTLMQGWVEYDDSKPEMIATLATNFAQIQFIIDDLFNQYKR